jgi:autotransporter translocation and assembly factor TamB
MKTVFQFLLKLIIIFLLLGCLGVYALLYSSQGLMWSIHFANKYLPLEIEDGHGQLASHFVLHNVKYTRKSLNLSIKKLDLTWQPFQLIHHIFFIQNLSADNVDVFIQNAQNESTDKQWIKQLVLSHATISNLHVYKDNQLFSQITQIQISPAENASNQFKITLPQGTLAGRYKLTDLERLQWHISMDADKVTTNYLWPKSDAELSFHLDTSGEWNLKKQTFNLSVTKLTGNVQQYPLSGIIDIETNHNRLYFKNIDISIGKAFFKLQGDASQQMNLHWNVSIPNLHSINADLSGSIMTDGYVKTQNAKPIAIGSIQVRQLKYKDYGVDSIDGKLFSDIKARDAMRIQYAASQIKMGSYVIPKINFLTSIKLNADKLSIDTIALLSKVNQARISIVFDKLFQKTDTARPLQGEVALQINDLNQYITSSDIKSLQGKISGHIKLSGTIERPLFNGSLDLKNTQFSFPSLNITIRDIQFHQTFSQDLIFHVSGHFSSGTGHGNVKGIVDFSKPTLVVNMNLQGNQLLVANLKEYKITASPNLTFLMQGTNATITGNLLLPTLRVSMMEYSNIVTLPSEFRFAGQKPPVYSLGNVSLGIKLSLGNDVHIDYEKLHADLAGSISVYQKPGGIPSGSGALIVTHGTYQIYDKLFSITNGRLVYVGNLLTNPVLSIEAVQQVTSPTKNFLGFNIGAGASQIKIAVMIRGTLKNPTVSLISTPSMSQDDILSHLLFNQSRSSISGLSALSLLGSASSEMNLQEPTLGDEPNPPSGLLGIFKVGIFNPAQALNFNLPISKYWKIQTETSLTETGVDLLYEFETD